MSRFERQQLRSEARTLAAAARTSCIDMTEDGQAAIRALCGAIEKLANVIESIDNEPKASASIFDRRLP